MWDWFSATLWAEDTEAAQAQANEWIATTAVERLWPFEWEEYAYGFVSNAALEASDAYEFWDLLFDEWTDYVYSAEVAGVEGWLELAEVWDSAAGTAGTTEEARQEGSLGNILKVGAGDTAQDLIKYAVVGLLGYGLIRYVTR